MDLILGMSSSIPPMHTFCISDSQKLACLLRLTRTSAILTASLNYLTPTYEEDYTLRLLAACLIPIG